jgi:hypothetical protein
MVQALVEVVIGDRKLIVNANTAKLIREASERNVKRNARISEDLRQARLLPSAHRNQFAGWVSTCTNLHNEQTSLERRLTHIS